MFREISQFGQDLGHVCVPSGQSFNFEVVDSFRMGLAFLNCGGNLRHRRRFKHFSQTDFLLESFTKTGGYLSGKKRMSTQFEKVVIEADLIDVEHLTPNLGYQLLNRSFGSDELFLQRRSHLFWCGKRGAIDLAVRRER